MKDSDLKFAGVQHDRTRHEIALSISKCQAAKAANPSSKAFNEFNALLASAGAFVKQNVTLPVAPSIDSVTADQVNKTISVQLSPGDPVADKYLVGVYGDSDHMKTLTDISDPVVFDDNLTSPNDYTVYAYSSDKYGNTSDDQVTANISLLVKPTIDSVTAGDGSVDVAYTDGNLGQATSTIEIIVYDNSDDSVVSTNASASTPETVSGLTNGTTYYVRIKSTGSGGVDNFVLSDKSSTFTPAAA